MSDWLPLRAHLRAAITEQLDRAALRDAALYRLLTDHRERVLAFAVDQVELCILRQLLSDRADAAERASELPAARLAGANGHA